MALPTGLIKVPTYALNALLSISGYAQTAAAILNAAVAIGEAAGPIGLRLFGNIRKMVTEERGPNTEERAELDAMMVDYNAKLQARAQEAGE